MVEGSPTATVKMVIGRRSFYIHIPLEQVGEPTIKYRNMTFAFDYQMLGHPPVYRFRSK